MDIPSSLLIYLSAGVSGLTSIVGVFFLKDYLNLTAAFIVSIDFGRIPRL